MSLNAQMTQPEWIAHLEGALVKQPHNAGVKIHLRNVRAMDAAAFDAHKAKMYAPTAVAQRDAAIAAMLKNMKF